MDLNIDTAKSYATEANLLQAIAKAGFAGCRYLIVRNRAGRFTAIFSIGLNQDFVRGNITIFARKGFVTFG